MWHGSSYFELMVGFRCGTGLMKPQTPSCQRDTMQANGGSIMVWGVFIGHGLGALVQLTRSLTSYHYVELLGHHLQPFMVSMHPHKDGAFKQDNTSCRWAQVIHNWFKEHTGEWTQLLSLSHLPDMNPIEHLWDGGEVQSHPRSCPYK